MRPPVVVPRLAILCSVVAALSLLVDAAPAAAQKSAASKSATKKTGGGGRWRQIGTTSSNNPVYLDSRSVTRANGIITATVRVQFVEPVATPQGAWTSARTVAMFDCAHQTVAVKENTYFLDEKKNLVAQHKVVGKPGFGTTIKGTLADVALLHLCGAGK